MSEPTRQQKIIFVIALMIVIIAGTISTCRKVKGAVPVSAVQAAEADYAAHLAVGEPTRYVSQYETEPTARPVHRAVTSFQVAVASRASLLEDQIPEQLPGTQLYRIRLNGLQWNEEDVATVFARSPYVRPGNKNPLIVRADWLIQELHDGTKSDSYYRLLYGGKNIPKTRDQYLAFWGISRDANKGLEFGQIEGQSSLNKAGTGARWIEHNYGVGREHWGTRDVFEVRAGRDPLNAPNGDFEWDGEEHFVLMQKTTTGGKRGVMPAPILANGKGEIVQEAPAYPLEDYTRLNDSPVIRNPGCCFSCHDSGAQPTTVNAIAEVLKNGTLLYAKDRETQSFIERFHLGGVDKELTRWSADYDIACKAATGLDSQTLSRAYRQVIADYAADVTLERAAGELLVEADELRKAIGYASANKIDVGVRLAELAAGRSIPRAAWEDEYHKAESMLAVWRQAT